MNEIPITEDDLHAFVDEQLGGLRYAEVAAYLESHQDVAAHVIAWRTQRQQLRDALAPIAAEPLPPELNLRRILETHTNETSWSSTWRLPYWAMSVAASVLLMIGGAGGWMVRGMSYSTGLMALGQIVAGTQGAAVLLMYDDDKGTSLVMLAQPMPKREDSTMTAVAAGDVHGFVWLDGGFGYSLVGATAPEMLHPLADAIRQEIRARS